MAIVDRLRRLFSTGDAVEIYQSTASGLPRGVVGPYGTIGGGWPIEYDRYQFAHWNRYNGFPGTAFTFGNDGACGVSRVRKMTPSLLYRTQPHLQTVVAFRARNVAQLPLHAYVVDGEKHEREHGIVDDLFHRPNFYQTGFELIRDTVTALDLYGRAYWSVLPSADSPSGFEIQALPVEWVSREGGTAMQPRRYVVKSPLDGREIRLDARQVVEFAESAGGWVTPVAPLETLREILAEQVAAWEYRAQVWAHGARINTYVYRPKDAPVWSEEARDRFTEDWHEFQGDRSRAGESPLLEDGMELRSSGGFSSRENEWTEVAKLSLQTVCSVYHVPPAMVGAEGSTSYASAREFRSMLYTETLGPIIRQLEQRINEFVLPLITDDTRVRVKFNIDAKLAGSFEEQASVLSTSTGAPWMTVNEARALRNLPPVEGGDQLVVPLNVTQGGQASPQSGEAPSVAVQNALAVQNNNDGEGVDSGGD